MKYNMDMKTYDTMISIPPEMDGPETLHPTLGPKVFKKIQIFLIFIIKHLNYDAVYALKSLFYI